MTKITINAEDYLSTVALEELTIQVFREKFEEYVGGSNIETVISNLGYKVYWEMIDEVLRQEGETAHELIKAQVLGHLRKKETYGIFRDADRWGRKESVATQIMNDLVRSKKDVIEHRVDQLLSEFELSEIRSVLHQEIDDYFSRKESGDV